MDPTIDPTPAPDDRPPVEEPPPIPERWAFAELFALSGLAITQPLLDIFGRAPDHFIFRGVDGPRIVLFGVLVTIAVPVAGYALERLVGLAGPAARRQTHELLLGLLVAAFTTLLVDGILERLAALVTGLLIAAVFVLLLQRTRGTRIWIRFLTPAPIAFLALFLLASPVAPLIRGSAGAHDVRIGRPTPTIVILLEIDIPWTVDGRSVFDGGSGHPDEIGLYRTIGGSLPGEDAYRSFDRERTDRLLMERTTGAFAPAADGLTGSARIFAVGPRPDLVGRPVPDGLAPIDAILHADSRADDVDPASGVVPALVRAEVPDLPAGETVAIAVNGTIRATTRTHGSNPVSVAAILPTTAFHEGPNSITLHRLDQP